jgi:Cu-processing system ATP-binding protein
MIEFRNLEKRFGSLAVLQGVTVSIEAGSVTAILGPNGSGKTTLMKSLVGLVQPDGGEILIHGQPVVQAGKPTTAAYRANIGYMPQIARFQDHLTARELFAMMHELRGGARVSKRSPAHSSASPMHSTHDEDLIEQFELAPHLDKPLKTLSGGTRQKVNAVVALMFNAEILLLDEPTAGLDPVAASTLKDRIHAERAAGKAILLTSHVMSEIEELATMLVLMLEGKVYFQGTPKHLLDSTGERTIERAVAGLLKAMKTATTTLTTRPITLDSQSA